MSIKIILIAFIVFALFKVIERYRKGDMKRSDTFFWIIFWVAAGIAVFDPAITVTVANLLGVGRGSDLIFYFSLAIIFYLLFRIFIKFEKIERSITEIVRKLALEDNLHDNKKK